MATNHDGSYRGLKFPPYTHREYPKWVAGKIVKNEAEELLELERLEALDNQEREADDRHSGKTNRTRSNPLRS